MDVISGERIGAVNEEAASRLKRRRAAAAARCSGTARCLGTAREVGLQNKITVVNNALHEGGGRQSRDHACREQTSRVVFFTFFFRRGDARSRSCDCVRHND